MRLLLLIPFILLFVKVKAQDTIQYLDTIVFKDQTKQAINVLDFSGKFIEYNKAEGNKTYFVNLNTIDHVIFRDGMTLSSNASDNDELSHVVEFSHNYKIKNDSLKRANDLYIGSNFASLIRHWSYTNNILNVGSRYYYKSATSIGVDMYFPVGFSNDGAQLDYGFEANFGVSTSLNRPFDIGFRTGVQLSIFHYFEYFQNLVKKYSAIPIAGVETEYYQGHWFYLFDNYYETIQSKRHRFSVDPYVSFEIQYKINRWSIVSNFGLKYTPNFKYDSGLQEGNYMVKEYYSTDYETPYYSKTTLLSSSWASVMSDYTLCFVFRTSIFYQIGKFRNKH